MDTIRLRTLTWKSVMWFGQYKGLSVKQISDLKHHPYLRYIYYNKDGISFNDEVLMALGIWADKFDYRIEKPGSDHDLGEKMSRIMFSRMCKHVNPLMAKGIMKIGMKIKIKRRVVLDEIIYSKGNLQRMNQGHSYRR